MGLGDKFDAAKDQVVGGAKEKVGDATGDEKLQAEGVGQGLLGDIKEGVENLKDKAKDIFDGDKK